MGSKSWSERPQINQLHTQIYREPSQFTMEPDQVYDKRVQNVTKQITLYQSDKACNASFPKKTLQPCPQEALVWAYLKGLNPE